MNHQSGKTKLNMRSSYRKAYLRNQVIHLITFGHLKSTKANVKEVRRLAEKLVTVAKFGNDFNARRKAYSMLPYKESALLKLFTDIAPKYKDRPGGYTRIISLGRRPSDTAQVARLEWV